MVFAVRTRTFPKERRTTTFYIGTNDPAELEELRRRFFQSGSQLPISGEYLDRTTFDLAEKYGKDTFVGLKYWGSRRLRHMFALKTWVTESARSTSRFWARRLPTRSRSGRSRCCRSS